MAFSEKRRGANQHVWLDKDGTPCYDGDAAAAEEWDERVRLGFLGVDTLEKKKGFVARVKNSLTERAWTLCHKDEKISVAALNKYFKKGNTTQEKEDAVEEALDMLI
eukprot:5068916-Pyramimonas_sp.AAC.1